MRTINRTPVLGINDIVPECGQGFRLTVKSSGDSKIKEVSDFFKFPENGRKIGDLIITILGGNPTVHLDYDFSIQWDEFNKELTATPTEKKKYANSVHCNN